MLKLIAAPTVVTALRRVISAASIGCAMNGGSATAPMAPARSCHGPLANVRVTGSWSNGAVGECVTSADGRCAVQQGGIPKQTRSVSFSVTSISGAADYRADRNHYPDGDSNGTTIVVKGP